MNRIRNRLSGPARLRHSASATQPHQRSLKPRPYEDASFIHHYNNKICHMEPLSALGAVGSIVSIIDVASKTINSLRRLQQKWSGADWTVSLLVGQLNTLNAALEQISEWMSKSLETEPQHHQLTIDLDISLKSCKTLVLFIDGHLSCLEWNGANMVTIGSRVKAILNDESIMDCVNHLHGQIAALNLLLTALNCRSMSEQGAFLGSKTSRSVFDRVRDDSSSLFCLEDSSSFQSSMTTSTELSSLHSRRFSSDHETLRPRVHQGQIKLWVRRGLCRDRNPDGSSERKKARLVEEQLEIHRRSEIRTVKLLLVEPFDGEESIGLETFELYNTRDIDNDLRLSHKADIVSIVYDTMRAILQGMKVMGSPILVDPKYQSYIQTLEMQPSTFQSYYFPVDVATAIAALWKNDAVKQLYHRCKEKISCRASHYYLDSIDRIARPGYLPNNKDIAKLKSKNCGVEETAVNFGSLAYRIMKPDKAILAHRKLFHLFEDVRVVIFVVDSSGYDETVKEYLFKDEAKTHLSETLTQFEDVCNSKWLSNPKIILVLHRLEDFREKIATNPLRKYFPDYEGGADYASALAYISNRFTSLERSPDQVIIHHFMPQEDGSSLVRFTVSTVQEEIVKACLADLGEL